MIILRIVIDLDGVICTLKKEGESYSEVAPLPGAIEKLKQLKKDGHYIIIHTARHMLTTENNMGLINKKIGKITLDWLEKYQIPYDEIYFGKPYGKVYIDDSAIVFKSWSQIDPKYFDEEKINIVIPMAGEGSRFKKAGFEIPKPLIKIQNKKMFKWAVESFANIKQNYQLIFIVLKKHVDEYKIDEEIKTEYPNSKVIVLNKITRGQAETVLKAKKYIDNFNKLVIFNSDTYFESRDIENILNNDKIDGALACFKDNSNSERYSFVKMDKQNNLLDIAEKKRISDFASNGFYYFKHGKDYVDSIEEIILNDERIEREFYVIPTYKKLLNRGFRLKIFLVDKNWIMGTPEELDAFNRNFKHEK